MPRGWRILQPGHPSRQWVALAAMLVAAVFLQRAQTVPAGFFADVTSASKVQFGHQASPTTRKYLVESMSGGVAVFDFNNDGLLDIFLVNGAARSEEHTSELQSHLNLVCRLLLEKKKTNIVLTPHVSFALIA